MENVLNEEAVADRIVAKVTATASKKRGVKPGTKRTTRPARALASLNDDEVLLTTEEACIFFGGPGRPIHAATLYRGAGDRYPRPVMIGPNSVRWLLSECRAALQKFIDARGKAA